MSFETTVTEPSDEVLLVTRNRPEELRRMDPGMAAELATVFERANAAAAAGLGVLTRPPTLCVART